MLNRHNSFQNILISPYLTEIHDNTLVNLLPQVSSEDLDQRDLEGWNFTMHEDSSKVQLHLETHIYLKKKQEE